MKTNSNLAKKVLVTLLAASSLFFVACKKNDNSSGNASTPQAVQPGWTGCATCVSSIGSPVDGLIGVLASSYDQKVLMSLDIILDGARLTNANPADPKLILSYMGPVVLQGAIKITAPTMAGYCTLPPGDYGFLPLSASATSSQGVVSGGQFEAVSAAGKFVFSLNGSSVYNSQDPQGVNLASRTNRIQMNLRIESLNGQPQPCNGMLSTY